MNCLYKIESSQPLFSKTEQKIAAYITENQKKILSYTAQTLAEQIPTSAAAIIRFSKKIGYSGFSALKLDLASDREREEPLNLMDMIEEEDTFSTLMRKTKASNESIVDQTYSLVQEELIVQTVQYVQKAKRIYLIGDGASATVCQDFEQKLLRLGYTVFFHLDAHVRIASIHQMQEEDVLIAVSYSGQTSDIVKLVEYAKLQKTPIVGISKMGRSGLQKLCDVFLPVPQDEGELRFGAISSRISSLIYTDLIYLVMAKQDLKQTKEKLKETKNLVKKIL